MRPVRCLAERLRRADGHGLPKLSCSPIVSTARLLAVVMWLLGAASVTACTFQQSTGGDVALTINAWDDVEQDKLLGRWTWAGSYHFLEGCTPGAVVPFDVTASMPGLEFVRNVTIEGVRYPAFGLTAYGRGPLLIFKHAATDIRGGGPDYQSPLDVARGNHIPSIPMNSSGRGSYVLVAAVSRGGGMASVPATLLGSIRQVSALYPSWIKTDTFTVVVNLRVPTCAMTDTPVTLADVAAADLPSSGSHAGERGFDVVMNCNGAFPVDMVLTDANSPGNTGSRLEPTAHSTAGAVRVELLREGAPVALGNTWTIPMTQNGTQNIRLAARYYRETGVFHGGVVEGQALITATYR